MNDKITFPRLASMLADRSGRSKRFSEDFLREFFTLISERLEAGESVKVKGLGTFRLSRVEPRRSVDVTTGQPMEISGHSKVVFVPSKELAEAVNAPFEAFTAVEIGDDVDLGILFASEENEDRQSTPLGFLDDDAASETELELDSEEAVSDPSAEITPYNNIDYNADSNSAEIHDSDPSDRSDPSDPSDPSESSDSSDHSDRTDDSDRSDRSESSDPSDSPDDADDSESVEFSEGKPAKKTWKRILLVSFGAAIVALAAIIGVWYVYFNDDFNRVFDRMASATLHRPALTDSEATDAAPIAPSPIAIDLSDSANDSDSLEAMSEDVPTAPSDSPVYDTIGTTRYLTTMAKSHYGNFNFWPYIYEENKARLGHPDRIRPGTPIVIPRLSKFGVDPSKPEEIEKAKKMGVEIYARYGKKI